MVQPYLKPVPDWEEHEKPTMPGSASMPWHPPYRRAAYALVSLLVAITGGLGNALVTANLPFLQGQLALTPTQGSWLVAAYAMVNVTANLLAFKFRQQYGIRLFAEIGLGLYAALAVLHLFVGSFETTMLTRAASGFAGAACSTLGTLYMLQALPRRFTGNLLVVGVGLSQLAVPIAWIVSPGLVDTGQWHQLYSFEAGLALCAFAAVVVLKLPPGIQVKAFEPLDFLTFALLAPAVALLVIVLAQGYTRWWLNTPWLGWALVASIVLSTTAFIIEHYRRNPLLQIRWLSKLPVLHFIVGAFLIRFLTTEQSYGVVNLMRTLGMGPDQMRPLFVVILAGVIVGIAGASLTFGPKRLIAQLLMAILLLGAAAFFDPHQPGPAARLLRQPVPGLGRCRHVHGPADHARHLRRVETGRRPHDHLPGDAVDHADPGWPGRFGGAGDLPAASRAAVFQRADQPARSGRSGGRATAAHPAAAVRCADHRPGAAQCAGQRAAGADHAPRSQRTWLQ